MRWESLCQLLLSVVVRKVDTESWAGKSQYYAIERLYYQAAFIAPSSTL